MPEPRLPSLMAGVLRALRWLFYIAIAAFGVVFLYYPLWPRGGPDTKQAREVAILLGSVLGVLGICVVVIQLTDPQLR
jgi:formate-dependent nitrite reductase membrane component NrfD